MPKMNRFLLAILLSSVATACTRTEAASSEAGKSAAGARVEVVSKKRGEPAEGMIFVRFRVENGGASGIGYRGWSDDSPTYTLEVQEDGAWSNYQIGWCGTGLLDFSLKPGAEMAFDVPLPADRKTYRATFGDPPVVTPPVVAEAP